MLIPLTRKTFEELVPAVATGAQFAHCWGKLSDLLRRVLISVVGMFVVILLKALFLREGFDEFLLVGGIVVGLYWLWGPVVTASLQNIECRRYAYCGFWQGKVLDVYVTEELIGTEETVNSRGDLVIVENRERCLNLEVGDELGFLTCLRVPLKRSHRAVDVGDIAELLVFSNRADLGRISKTSDIYLSDHSLWVSDYPFVRRDAFIEVSRRINRQLSVELPDDPVERPKRKRTPKSERRSELVQRERSRSRDRYSEDDLDSYPETELPRRRSPRRRSANQW